MTTVEDRCARCGQAKADHAQVVRVDPEFIGHLFGIQPDSYVYICQTALFASQTKADADLQALADAP